MYITKRQEKLRENYIKELKNQIKELQDALHYWQKQHRIIKQ